MSTEDQLQSNVVIFSVSVMKNIEKSTDSISSNELALLSGRIPEVEYPKKAFELKDVLVLPCKTENVFLFLDRIAKDTRYQQGFCDARRAFMERAAESSDAIPSSTTAQALDLGLDTVRLLANDNDEQVCEDLTDNPAFLQLPAEEQVRFCRAHIDCLETVVRTYCYRTDAHTDFAAAPELIKAFADHADPHVRIAIAELAESFLWDKADAFCSDSMRSFTARRKKRNRAFSRVWYRYSRDWSADMDVQRLGKCLLASRRGRHCSETDFGLPGEYVYAFGFTENLTAEDAADADGLGSLLPAAGSPLFLIPLYELAGVVSRTKFGPGDTAFLERLAVHPSYRARRVVAEMNDLPLCLEKQLAEDAFASVGNRLTQRAAEKAAND